MLEREVQMMPSRFCLVFAVITLNACTTLTYEGAGDVRVGSIVANAGTGADRAKFDAKFERSSTADAGTAFKPHDPISIYLKNAFFSWCPPHPYEQASAQLDARSPKCRIAVVVNVGSRLEQNLDPASGSNPGRIVFYSRDIQRQQFVNQSFGPVYSRADWDGNDLTLDVTVLAMNEEDTARSEAMLKVLAGLGTSPLLSTGGQQLISALNRVGAAFVQASGKDSVIGYYRFTTLARNTASAAYIPILKEGDLILMRARDETRETIDWKNYIYNPSVGKMFQRIRTTDTQEKKDLCNKESLTQADLDEVAKLETAPSDLLCYVEDHHRNYLVFSFVKAAPGGDWAPTTTLSALQTAIQSSSSVAALQQAVGTISDAAVERGKFLHARDAIAKLKDAGTPAAVKTYEARQIASTIQCGYINSLDPQAPNVPALATWAQANCGGANWRTTNLATNEFESLAQRVLSTCAGITIADTDLLGASRDQTTAPAARSAFAAAIAACH